VSLEVIQSILVTKIYPALLVLFFFGLTIFIHELGHFLVAKRRGMRIERFSIGFGPKIFGWTKDGVEYRVSWVPFGGYVALPQMSPMETIEGKTEASAEELPPVPPPTKSLVAVAGPLMNIALALVLAAILWGAGKPMNVATVGWVEMGSAEELAGIQPGDKIVNVNGHDIRTWTQLMEAVAFSRTPDVRLTIERAGKRREVLVESKVNERLDVKMLDIYPRNHPFAQRVLPGSAAERAGLKDGDEFVSIEGVPIYSSEQLRSLVGKRTDMPTTVKVLRRGKPLTLTVTPELSVEEKVGRMGVQLGDRLEIVRPGPNPLRQIRDVLASMVGLIKALLHSKETGVGPSSVSGPVGILGLWWYGIVTGGLLQGINIAVMLNVNFAVINLFPLPVLDGGHILFAVIEAIRRRPLNARIVQALSSAFAVLLITFMVYITLFDFKRFFGFRFGSAEPPTQTNETVPATQP